MQFDHSSIKLFWRMIIYLYSNCVTVSPRSWKVKMYFGLGLLNISVSLKNIWSRQSFYTVTQLLAPYLNFKYLMHYVYRPTVITQQSLRSLPWYYTPNTVVKPFFKSSTTSLRCSLGSLLKLVVARSFTVSSLGSIQQTDSANLLNPACYHSVFIRHGYE